ncbi:MAG: hypothetical protein IKO61_00945 [Lachnospiraceae bacterium]|nr:hypothetical protein [Lachnospiraceae bacterium]
MEKSLDEDSVNEECVSAGRVMPASDPAKQSALALAYIGDSALDLYVKTFFVKTSDKQTYKYHRDVSAIVKAVNQAAFAEEILEELNEGELSVYKRGRNANTHSKAKNATRGEYMKATGLEALFGYLYLKDDKDRFAYFADRMIEEYLSGKDK